MKFDQVLRAALYPTSRKSECVYASGDVDAGTGGVTVSGWPAAIQLPVGVSER